ncbi:protein lava lamp [Frankliniella occidentalis]|uniref:Protein lava lamp n=1 Tax=Frankliniella occidentalis TaxID=133901 RepID=A0A9C6X3A3_FRAOC|nr:protein lava lamp [Frankliniella occidentalis]
MEEPESYPIDSEDVREQIEQQRTLAAQLREKLEQDELQLASKEQQNELLKSKLSLLKSRTSKSKRNVTTNEKDDIKSKIANEQSGSPKNPGKKQTSNSASKGKINILREQLEQNRLRFERHGLELSEDTRSMEAMVEQLRHDLEERDVTIQQLQAGQEPPLTPNSEVQVTQPRDLPSQLFEKEQEVINLSAHVTELQNTILELQENLKEKDCVIEARTQAISLLSEDMSKKWRSNVDMLEETRQQMQMMQENFVRIEAGLKAEIEQLTTQLQNNSTKLSQAEQNVKDAETARNDLVSKNAELLEEMKKYHETPKTSTGLEEANLKIKELSEALTEANKLTVKLKAEHKAKIKTLNKQIDSLRKESDLSGELVQLQNHIAELEEEKGNLQLLLLEIEESTAIQEQKIKELQTHNLELHNQKVEAEMKLVEWEEQQSSNESIEQDIADMKLKLKDKDLEIQNLKEQITNTELSSKADDITLYLEKQLEEAQSAIKEWETRYENLEKQYCVQVNTESPLIQHELTVLEEHTPSALSLFEEKLKHKVDILEQSVLDKQSQVQELQAIVQASLEKIERLTSANNTEKDCENCNSYSQRLLDQEAQSSALQTHLKNLEDENESLKTQYRQADVQFTAAQPPSLAESASEVERRLIEASGELDLKKEECARLESKLKAQVEKVKKLAVNLKVKTVANKELEERANKYETMLQSSKIEFEQLVREKQDILEKWQIEVSEKDTNLSQATEALASRELEILNLREELSTETSALIEIQAKFDAMQSHAESLQSLADERLAMLDNLSRSNAELDQQMEIAKFVELQTELASIQKQLALESEEKQAALNKLENFTKQAKIKLAKEKKLRLDLLQKQEELQALLTEKSNTLDEVQNKHTMTVDNYEQELGKFDRLLKEQQDQVSILHEQLEQEKNKLQYANETVNTEEVTEEAQDLQSLLSAESFQREIENLCASTNYPSPIDVLPILQDEKANTMNELGYSFELLHSQIVARLQNRPDLHADRKLFAELRNLVTRVINRTAALENKIKSIVSESDSLIQRKLFDAEKSIETLESSLSEARAVLDQKEGEKVKLEDEVNNFNKERWDLSQKIQEESQKSLSLETMLNESYGQINTLVQSTSSLQDQISEKDALIQDLQTKYQSIFDHCNVVQQELSNAMQANHDLKSNIEELMGDCEMWKSKLLTAEQELSDVRLTCTELQASYGNSTQRCEVLQRQLDETSQQSVDTHMLHEKSEKEREDLQHQLANLHLQLNESIQLRTDLQLQLDKSLQETEELQHQLADAASSISHLQQELLDKTETHSSTNIERSGLLPDAIPSITSAREKELQQQLIEKTAEVENYQRRLIQLQMGASDPGAAATFSFQTDRDQVTEVFDAPAKASYQETGISAQSHPSHSTSIFDAFKPAASFFETSPEQSNELEIKLQTLTEQLETSVSEKKSLELEMLSLRNNLDRVNEELKAAKEEVESMYPSLSKLQSQVSELTIALEAAQACAEQEKENVQKLEHSLEKMKRKLENAQFDKEKIENELEIRDQKEADQRPDIPQTLDTHVSSLQDSGSGFNNEEGYNENDESVMESNMTQLESELRGMVMSRQESLLKQKAMEGCWDTGKAKPPHAHKKADVKEGDEKGKRDESAVELGSLKSEVSDLKEKLIQLESEKNRALSQIDKLQAELQTISQSGAPSSTDHTVLSVPDSFINDDDSWGWGADSAHLEVQHQQQKSQIEPTSGDVEHELQKKIESLQSEYESLEREKIQLAEDLKASQIRAAKLTRKLRDLKTKYDEVSDKSRSTDSPFDSLDQAIEEERMKQMQGLEKELKEVQAELNAFKAERDRLQKQVEVFSSANERMLEIKERQDVEVEMWQKRSKDLTNQVQAMEWRIRELEEGKEEKSEVPTENLSAGKPSPPTELNSTEVDQLLKENHTWNSNYENLMQEYQKLRAQCLAESEQRTQIDALVAQQKGMIERLEHEKTYFQDVYDSLKMDYESACAQLASKDQDESTELLCKKCEELKEKLVSAEQHLQETTAELQAVSSDNVEFQAQCSQLNDARKELLQQLEQSQEKLEANAQEISHLQEKIRVLEENSFKETAVPNVACNPVSLQDEFIQRESIPVNSHPNSSILNWSSVVPRAEEQSADVFESIASSNTQALEEQLLQKENEMQKDKRMIETLKRTMEESGQEWSQLIEYHKNQLEAAQTTINGLQMQLEELKQETITKNECHDLEHVYSQQVEKCQELESIIFAKDKEIETLQINLSVNEELKKKLDEQLHFKKDQVEKLLSDISQLSAGQVSLLGTQPSPNDQGSNTTLVKPVNVPAMNSSDKNLSNELDLALYMLHERDVRCEELTLELTQLLEERDGLQLRLSNAIRSNEELRERLKHLLSNQPNDLPVNPASIIQRVDEADAGLSPENSITALPPTFIPINPEAYTVNLQNKLTELRKMGYSHDKSFKEDSEYRHQQQMRLMSPSPTSSLSGNASEVVNVSNETTAGAGVDVVSTLSNTDPNNADQSSCIIS